MSEMAGGELLVVATIRDELVGPLEAIRTELGRVAAAQEQVAATSTSASAGLTREGAAAERTTGKLRAVDLANKNAARSFGVLGVQVPKTAAVVAVALAASVYAAAKFESALTRVETQAGASAEEVGRLRGELLKMASGVATTPDQLAESLYHVESAGFRGAQALSMVDAAARGAAIGSANLEDTTQAMIASIASGIKGVHGSADAMALLNRTVGIGDMRMQQLTRALASGILPSARSAGLRFNDVAAALATITDNATPADEAATRLRMTFALLSSPSHNAEKALGSIGMTSTQMARDMRQPRGLLVALTDLQAHLHASGKSAVEQNQVLERAFGGGRTSGAILTLLGQMDRLTSKYNELGTASERQAEFDAAWATYTDTLAYKWHSLVAGLETGAIVIGSKLLPAVKFTLDALITMGGVIGDAVGWANDHRTAIAALAIVISAMLYPAIVTAGRALLVMIGEGTIAGAWRLGNALAATVLKINAMTLGIAAFGAMALWAWSNHQKFVAERKQQADDYVASLGATTTNLQSQLAAIKAIDQQLALGKTKAVGEPKLISEKDFAAAAESTKLYTTDMGELESQRQKLLAQSAAMRVNEASLGSAYHLSAGEVEALAKAHGIDLSGALSKVGPEFDDVMASVVMSHHTTRQAAADINAMASSATSAADAVTLLKDSLDALSGNAIAADEAAIAFRDRIVALDKALRHSHGSMSMNSKAGRAARQAFDEATSSASQWTVATQQATDDQGKSAAALKRSIGFLEPFAKGNNYAAQQVKALRTELRQLQGNIDGLHGKTVHVNVVGSGVAGQRGGQRRIDVGGDTPGPRAGRFGDVMDLHRRLSGVPGKRSITSHVRGWGLGSANSDHATGRAIDVVGSGLGGYQVAARRAGAFAEFHGDGEGRHLHVAGDTPGPRAPRGGGGGDDGGVHLHVHLEAGAVVVGAGADPEAVADAVERGVVRGGRRALDRARVGPHRFGNH